LTTGSSLVESNPTKKRKSESAASVTSVESNRSTGKGGQDHTKKAATASLKQAALDSATANLKQAAPVKRAGIMKATISRKQLKRAARGGAGVIKTIKTKTKKATAATTKPAARRRRGGAVVSDQHDRGSVSHDSAIFVTATGTLIAASSSSDTAATDTVSVTAATDTVSVTAATDTVSVTTATDTVSVTTATGTNAVVSKKKTASVTGKKAKAVPVSDCEDSGAESPAPALMPPSKSKVDGKKLSKPKPPATLPALLYKKPSQNTCKGMTAEEWKTIRTKISRDIASYFSVFGETNFTTNQIIQMLATISIVCLHKYLDACDLDRVTDTTELVELADSQKENFFYGCLTVLHKDVDDFQEFIESINSTHHQDIMEWLWRRIFQHSEEKKKNQPVTSATVTANTADDALDSGTDSGTNKKIASTPKKKKGKAKVPEEVYSLSSVTKDTTTVDLIEGAGILSKAFADADGIHQSLMCKVVREGLTGYQFVKNGKYQPVKTIAKALLHDFEVASRKLATQMSTSSGKIPQFHSSDIGACTTLITRLCPVNETLSTVRKSLFDEVSPLKVAPIVVHLPTPVVLPRPSVLRTPPPSPATLAEEEVVSEITVVPVVVPEADSEVEVPVVVPEADSEVEVPVAVPEANGEVVVPVAVPEANGEVVVPLVVAEADSEAVPVSASVSTSPAVAEVKAVKKACIKCQPALCSCIAKLLLS
jgi:hypothetical protein